MNDLVYLFGGAIFVAFVLASISIWAPRRVVVRMTAFVVSALFVPLSYAAFASLLSKPKPVALEWLRGATQEANVLGATINEGQAIYVWLQMPGVDEPRAYTLPWSMELAKQLQEARRKAEEQGTGLGMRLPFEHSWDKQEPKFYPLPQPALPPKDAPAAPMELEHPSTQA
ncbi:MAG TPA: hypothetical protein VHM01_11550 [Alphaproteobacteria bacterium]|nr:hypothetical protein [Alphaproteobacteria bacterium]